MSIKHTIKINFAFKNLQPTAAIKNYAEEKLVTSLQKFIHHELDLHLVLSVEKNRQIADANFRVDGVSIHSSQEADSLYAAIDKLVDNLSAQLRKNKEKITSHH
jgi:putative sigma-54 modulation protein